MLYSPSFITMAFANLFIVSSFGTFFLFPLFVTSHGGSKSDIGIIMGVFVGSIILGYIGQWADFRPLFFGAGLVPLTGLGVYKLQGMHSE